MLNTSDIKIIERWQSRTEFLELKMYWFDYESGFFFKKEHTRRSYILDSDIYLDADFQITDFEELLPTLSIHELLKQSGYAPIPVDLVNSYSRPGFGKRSMFSVLDMFMKDPSIYIRKEDFTLVYERLVHACEEVDLHFTFNEDSPIREFFLFIQTECGQEKISLLCQNIDEPFNLLWIMKQIDLKLQPLFTQLKLSNFMIDRAAFKQELSAFIKGRAPWSFSLMQGKNSSFKYEQNTEHSHTHSKDEKQKEDKDDAGYTLKQCYSLLGVNSSSTREDIVSAYRKLAKKFHPDTIQGKDLDEEFIKFATLKFKKIQNAYSTICTHKNWN